MNDQTPGCTGFDAMNQHAAESFHIRPMNADDFEQVQALWAECEGLGACGTHADFVRFLDRNPGLSPLAVRAGCILAAVQCGEDGHRGYLYHLGVARDARGGGLARRLVDWCLERLAARGIRRCSIFLYRDNRDGEQFWRRTGWRERTDLKVFARDLPAAAPNSGAP
jgi:ribosomal protein S18 acetylase RimI-like enzyme